MTCHNSHDNIMTCQESSAPLFDNLWSVARLAEYLAVPTPTIRDWVYKRKIPFVKVGDRLIRFQPSDIHKWLSERKKGDANS